MRLLRPLAVAALALQLLAPIVAAAGGDVPTRVKGQAVYDLAGALSAGTKTTAESILRTVRRATDTDVVLVVEPADGTLTHDALQARAGTLREALQVGATADGGVLVYVAAARFGCTAQVQIDPDESAAATFSANAAQTLVDRTMAPLIEACDLDNAVLVGLGQITTVLVGGSVPAGPSAGGDVDQATPAGPPFPAPIDGVRVYDTAHVFRPDTVASIATTIAGIEARTGAQVVVYSQVVESGRSTEEADGDARALLDQWGVGRKGFDDGLVILFDLYPGLDHGQVILYGGPGYRAAFLDNADKQKIFDEDMLPLLKAGDMDGAALVAIQRVDANATPEHAARLERGRQLNAVVGLVGAPLLAVLLIGSAGWSWLRFGRDPVYLDDPSIHMAGPPAALTPAAAVFVREGSATRRALTTALLDLASRGVITFREEHHLLGLQKKVGIETRPSDPDPQTRARQLRNDARRLGPAEGTIGRRVTALGGDDGYVTPDRMPELAPAVPAFNKALEAEVVRNGWYREAPATTTARWRIRSALVFAAGIGAVVLGGNLPSDGLILVGASLLVSAAIIFVLAGAMPAVTLPGAMIRAMLAAYRRTLKKTMEAARSMDQVVAQAGLSWLETPDQAVVWGTALGLHAEIEAVLGRSLEDLQTGRAAAGATYLPTWYGTSAGGGHAFASGGGDFAGASAGSGGLFSSSAIPDFGGMMSALGSIGNAPSSSGGGGGGGFGGGGSGGGGGGSGGGF
ncbi:MAG TPA: TPM domain-containing protein [Candidatus Limnocylindrales bacterium]|nr:TPM domain-containing protein [Candidatus Limnocylindrales bacterium]